MNKWILLACFSAGYTSSTAIAEPVSGTLQRIEAHAEYFGFQDPQAYLHFSAELNRLMAGDKTLGEPILSSTTYSQTLGAGMAFSALSSQQRSELRELVQARRANMAKSLGVSEAALQQRVAQYAAYSRLNARLHEIPIAKVVQNASLSDSPRHLELSTEQLAELGEPDSPIAQLAITQLAAQAGVPQFTPFVVHFSARGSEQRFIYNDFSGAWSISAETTCPSRECGSKTQ
ncbi:hypothetical protein ACLKZ7_20775 [Shewanella algae]|uniref:hypothetical protein n=1 Tax=Shewanella algae TaxID=38313 RepID=UPI00046991A3|nr:hypothetical protein [Shewanella algae]MBO2584820.1 hypothetical protein [Shewanella algae]MBO2589034.1 hypothetical protein [Shewanella algae]MDL2196651.1 hypothetical protein [Shewanella algae]NKZ43760.1 hypothetical protein [Shewanella algae]QNH97279.1 hypothetical protein HU689_00810 [Shewanella algae]